MSHPERHTPTIKFYLLTLLTQIPYLTWTVTRTLVSRSLLISAGVSTSNSLLLKPPAHSTLFDVISTAPHLNANHWPTHPRFAPLWNMRAQHGILTASETSHSWNQSNAGRLALSAMITGTQPRSVTTLLNQLEWPPLKERRQQARLILFSKDLTNDSAICLPPFPSFQNHKNT